MRKSGRGSSSFKTDYSSEVFITCWCDITWVSVCLTYGNSIDVHEVERWNYSKREHCNKCPEVVRSYNKSMGCVDLCDMFNFFVAHKYQDKTLVYQDASSLALVFQMSMPGICTNINVSILESRKYYN